MAEKGARLGVLADLSESIEEATLRLALLKLADEEVDMLEAQRMTPEGMAREHHFLKPGEMSFLSGFSSRRAKRRSGISAGGGRQKEAALR